MRRPNADSSRRVHEIEAQVEQLLLEKTRLVTLEDAEHRVAQLERDIEASEVTTVDLGDPRDDREPQQRQQQPEGKAAPPHLRTRSLWARFTSIVAWCCGKRRLS